MKGLADFVRQATAKPTGKNIVRPSARNVMKPIAGLRPSNTGGAPKRESQFIRGRQGQSLFVRK